MIEAAIIMPLLLIVTFAVIDFSVLFYVNLALENGVSQAVRYGITGETMGGMSRQESIQSVMRTATPTLTLTDDNFHFSHLVGGAWVQGTGGPGDIEKLTVTYSHQMFVLRPLFPGGQVELSVESSMKNEDRFQ
jgi:Flp pilus assembly protein TadG